MTRRSIRLAFLGDPRYDRRIQSFRESLTAVGHSVELVCGVSTTFEHDDPNLVLLHLGSSHGPQRFLEYSHALSKHLAMHPVADVLITSDLYGLGAAARAKRTGKIARLIYDSREVYPELPSVAKRPAIRNYWKKFEDRYLGDVDAILVTGTHDLVAIFEAHLLIPRSELIRNVPPLRDVIMPVNVHERYGIADTSRVFVYVGGLQPARGIAQFIQCLSAIDGSSVLLIGDGVERQQLEALAANGAPSQVVFAGALESEEALRVAAGCDVGISLIEPVSRSYAYALPSKLFEYMSLGLPVVCSPLVHVKELFGDREPWLFYADPANRTQIVEAANRALLATGNEAAREREKKLYRTEFNSTIELQKLICLIEQLF